MSRPQTTIKRRVWVGLVAAIVGVGASGWWAWNRRVPTAKPANGSQPFVHLAGNGTATTSKILQERAELMDPTPLFFPTEWNYGQQHATLAAGRPRQPGEVFGSFDPKLTVPDQNLSPYGAEATLVPEKLSDVLVQGNEAPFAGLGQTDIPQSILAMRQGYLEIRAIDTGENIVSQSLAGIYPPRADFPPVEFLVLIGPAGLVGEPTLTNSSGWDEVDGFFRSYLVKSYRLGARLSPGRYRVVIGT